MNAIKWLQTNAPGFADLSDDEQDAIMHFSLLWKFFEAGALNMHGNARSIVDAAKRWTDSGLLTEGSFQAEFTYFQNRYCPDGAFTYHYDQLHLRQNDQPDLVKGC